MNKINCSVIPSSFSKWEPSRELILAALITTLVLGILATYVLSEWHTLKIANIVLPSATLTAGLITLFFALKRECLPSQPPQLPIENTKEAEERKQKVREVWLGKQSALLPKSTPVNLPPQQQPRVTPIVVSSDQKPEDQKDEVPAPPPLVIRDPYEESRVPWFAFGLSSLDVNPQSADQQDLPQPTEEDLKEKVRQAWQDKQLAPVPEPAPVKQEPPKKNVRPNCKNPSPPKSQTPSLPTKKRNEKKALPAYSLPSPSVAPLSSTPPMKLDELLIKACDTYTPGMSNIFGRILRLVDQVVESKEMASLLHQTENGTFLEILLKKLIALDTEQRHTQELFMERLELEVLLRILIVKLSALPELQTQLESIKRETDPYLSKESECVLQESYSLLTYGIAPLDKKRLNNLILLDQGIKTDRKGGTYSEEGTLLNLIYLEKFLNTPFVCTHIHNTLYPLAENLSFFLKEVSSSLYKELSFQVMRHGADSLVAKNYAGELVEKVLHQVDQNAQDPLKRHADHVFAMGWKEHWVGVGVRKRGEDDYLLTVLNGGDGMDFQPLCEDKYNPLAIYSGTREEIRAVLTEFFLLNVRALDQTENILAENFYQVLKERKLKEEENTHLHKMREQDMGNCGIHNIRELIYYNIQRMEAEFAQENNLEFSNYFPSSIANKFQEYVYQTGKLTMQDNPYISEKAKLDHKKRSPLPGIIV